MEQEEALRTIDQINRVEQSGGIFWPENDRHRRDGRTHSSYRVGDARTHFRA
jgi:hypothetical protein